MGQDEPTEDEEHASPPQDLLALAVQQKTQEGLRDRDSGEARRRSRGAGPAPQWLAALPGQEGRPRAASLGLETLLSPSASHSTQCGLTCRSGAGTFLRASDPSKAHKTRRGWHLVPAHPSWPAASSLPSCRTDWAQATAGGNLGPPHLTPEWASPRDTPGGADTGSRAAAWSRGTQAGLTVGPRAHLTWNSLV